MATVLQHAVDVIEPAAAERQVTIEVDLGHGLHDVTAGPIYPVVANALHNAVEACSPGGRIQLTADVVGEQTVIAIRDNGCGVAPDMLGRVFELGATTKDTGSGIGLALSKEIVEQAGGVITLVNNPDGGATLRLTLPATPRR
jgi:signal transduction histidine kinase